MSYRLKAILPVIGLLLLCGYATLAVIRTGEKVQTVTQALPTSISNIATIRLIEVKDGPGQTVLGGTFIFENKSNGELEGNARLVGTGVNASAKGTAEFELSARDGVTERELEVSVSKLAPSSTFGLFLDGQLVATFTTNRRGAAKLKMADTPVK